MTETIPTPGGTAPLGDRSVARIGYGAMQLERMRDDRASAVALVRRAADLGVNHIDTAEFYGDGFVNGVIREALGPTWSAVVATKVGADPNPGGAFRLRPAQQPAQLRASVEDNLRSLDTDHIPLVYLRRMDVGPGIRADGDQVVDVDDQLAEFIAMREEGLIGGIGLGSVSLDVLQRAIPAGIVSVQNMFSLVARGDDELVRLCEREGIAWTPFFPLGSAFAGTPKVTEQTAVTDAALALGATPAQVGLAWLLAHSPRTLLIPGTADVSHLEANLAAGDIELDATTVARLDEVWTGISTAA